MNSKRIAAAAVFAAGIGVGMLLTNGRDAQAQGVAAGLTEPHVIELRVEAVDGFNSHHLYRLWSDGAVDVHQFNHILMTVKESTKCVAPGRMSK